MDFFQLFILIEKLSSRFRCSFARPIFIFSGEFLHERIFSIAPTLLLHITQSMQKTHCSACILYELFDEKWLFVSLLLFCHCLFLLIEEFSMLWFYFVAKYSSNHRLGDINSPHLFVNSKHVMKLKHCCWKSDCFCVF